MPNTYMRILLLSFLKDEMAFLLIFIWEMHTLIDKRYYVAVEEIQAIHKKHVFLSSNS